MLEDPVDDHGHGLEASVRVPIGGCPRVVLAADIATVRPRESCGTAGGRRYRPPQLGTSVRSFVVGVRGAFFSLTGSQYGSEGRLRQQTAEAWSIRVRAA